MRNLGAQLRTYAGVTREPPDGFYARRVHRPRGLPLLLNVNFHKLNEDPGTSSTGSAPSPSVGSSPSRKVLQLRFGYNNEQRKDLKIGTTSGLAGFSAGLGITVSDYRVDYALSSLGTIGTLHRLSRAPAF